MKNTIIFALICAAWGGVNVQAKKLELSDPITEEDFRCFQYFYKPTSTDDYINNQWNTLWTDRSGGTWGDYLRPLTEEEKSKALKAGLPVKDRYLSERKEKAKIFMDREDRSCWGDWANWKTTFNTVQNN